MLENLTYMEQCALVAGRFEESCRTFEHQFETFEWADLDYEVIVHIFRD